MSSTSAPLPLHLPGAVLARHEDVNAMTRWMFRADRYTARVLREIQAPRRDRATTWLLRVLGYPAYLAFVRGHEKVPTGGQVAVPSGGQEKSPLFVVS